MYPYKKYTRKITISILEYSTLCTRPTLHCSIHSVNPLSYRDGLSKEKWRALLSFNSNKALFSASLSFTMFIGPAAVAQQVLQKKICPSFPLSGCFLGTGSLIFSKFWHGLETQMNLCMTKPDFFRKYSFASNTAKMGQYWAKNSVFLNLLRKLVFNFHWICSIIKTYIICCVSVHNLYLVKILFMGYGSKCTLLIRLQYL